MIAPAVYNPAIGMARAQTRHDRFNAAFGGMIGALDTWRDGSPSTGASRRADGLRPIDAAVAAVRAGWQPNNGAVVANDAIVTTLLNACTGWLTARTFLGGRVTGWREAPIRKLHWQVAWAYCCDGFVQQATAQLAVNNAAGNATPVLIPLGGAAAAGSPYSFAASGYIHQPLPGVKLRGDTRGPWTIHASGGFQPIHPPANPANRWTYQPWFEGNSMTDTISVTTDVHLAVEAGPFARAQRHPRDVNVQAWLTALLPSQERGYVYEFGNLPAALSTTRVDTAVIGSEHIFLGLPNAMITRWWAVLANRFTFGPFPYPAVDPAVAAALAAPPPVPNQSAAAHTLA